MVDNKVILSVRIIINKNLWTQLLWKEKIKWVPVSSTGKVSYNWIKDLKFNFRLH